MKVMYKTNAGNYEQHIVNGVCNKYSDNTIIKQILYVFFGDSYYRIEAGTSIGVEFIFKGKTIQIWRSSESDKNIHGVLGNSRVTIFERNDNTYKTIDLPNKQATEQYIEENFNLYRYCLYDDIHRLKLDAFIKLTKREVTNISNFKKELKNLNVIIHKIEKTIYKLRKKIINTAINTELVDKYKADILKQQETLQNKLDSYQMDINKYTDEIVKLQRSKNILEQDINYHTLLTNEDYKNSLSFSLTKLEEIIKIMNELKSNTIAISNYSEIQKLNKRINDLEDYKIAVYKDIQNISEINKDVLLNISHNILTLQTKVKQLTNKKLDTAFQINLLSERYLRLVKITQNSNKSILSRIAELQSSISKTIQHRDSVATKLSGLLDIYKENTDVYSVYKKDVIDNMLLYSEADYFDVWLRTAKHILSKLKAELPVLITSGKEVECFSIVTNNSNYHHLKK